MSYAGCPASTREAAAWYARKSKPSVLPATASVTATPTTNTAIANTGRRRATAAPSARRPPAEPVSEAAISDGGVIGRSPGGAPDLAVDQRDPEEVPRDADREAHGRTHARPAAVRPLHGHDRVPVAAPAGEVDHLDVEHDARDLLAREQVPGDVPAEPLEPALGVLH